MKPTHVPTHRGTGGMRTNLVLALVLITVASFAYWFEFRKKGELQRVEEARTKLIPLDQSKEAESVRIVDAEKGLDLEMRCKEHCGLSDPAARWDIVSPIAFKADEGNVGTFITSVTAATIQETLPLEGDIDTRLQTYGLGKVKRDQRRAVIRFKGDPQPYTIYVGDNSAVGDNTYVYVSGPGQKPDVARIIPAYLKTSMQRALSYWRAKRLFEFATSEVDGFTLVNPAGRAELSRDQGNWYLPGKRLADNEAVDTFLTGLAFMNAHEYVSDDKTKDRGRLKLPSKPKYSLSIKIAKRSDVILDVYDVLEDKAPKLYAMLGDRNFIVELDRTNAEKFGKKEEAFRFHNLVTPAEKQEIRRVRLVLGKEKYEFQGEGAQWSLASGKIERFDPASVDQALTKVGAARVAEFLGKQPVPAGVPELSSWGLLDKDGKTLRTFAVHGDAEKGDYYVKLSTGELGKLERGSGSAIPTKAADFQKQAAATQKPGS